MQMMRAIMAGGLTVVLLGLTGCVGYQLGSSLPPDIKSVFVHTFVNQCKEPLVEIEATNATIAEFQKDGTLAIRQADAADVLLETTLTKVTLEPLAYERSDATKPKEYRLILTAVFVLRRSVTGKVIGNGECLGETTFVYTGNLASAKRSALPKASEDLAKRIVEQVVEAW